MKEQEPIGLTTKPLDSTLGVGGNIFMPEEGKRDIPQPQEAEIAKPKTIEDTVAHLARIRVEGEKAKPLGPDGLPLEFGSWPLAMRKAWMEKQRDSAGQQLLEQQITPREDPHAISPAQKKALDNVYIILEDDPEAFADAYVRAIDTLSQKRAEPIVHGDAINLIEQVLQKAQGQIPEESIERFRQRARKALELTPPEFTRKARRIIKDVAREPQRLERKAAKRVSEEPAPEPQPQQQEPSTEGGGGEEPPERPAPPTEPTPEEPQGNGEGGDNGGEKPPVPPEGQEPHDEISERERRIAEDALNRAAQYQRILAPIREVLQNPETIRSLREAGITTSDPEKILEQAFDFAKLERNIEERQRGKEPIYVPKSLEELAVLVMNRATPEYRKKGDKRLLNYKKDEQGRDTDIVESVNTVNFLDWARNNYFLVHLNNPTAPVNFFSDIATTVKSEGFGSPISFYEMTFTDSYYLKEERDEQGNVIGQVENDEYKALKTQMLMEVFLLQLQRNPAVSYVLQSRFEREKMLNALAEAFFTAPLTRSDFFETIFSQPSMHGKSIYDLDPSIKDGGELQAKIEGNFLMGDATREALAAYINIFSYEQLVKILGPDAPLFKYAYEKWNMVSGKPEEGTEVTAVDTTALDKPDKRKNQWFNEDGSLKLFAVDENGRYVIIKDEHGKDLRDEYGDPMYKKDLEGKPHPDFMKYVNIFLTPTPDQRQQNEIRERIRLSIMKRNGISYREAQIAELMAYSMTHIYGIAARNDTDSVAFDWWTRVQNFLDKRKREKSPTRNAPYGSKFNMEGFKRIGLNIFEGVRDIRRRSLREIIQGGTGEHIDIKGNPLKNDVDYERNENGLIIFFDPQTGEKIERVHAQSHEVLHINRTENGKEIIETEVIFKDENGEVLDIGEYRAKVKKPEKVKDPVGFRQAVQQGFLANHLVTGSKIYEWIMYKKELALPEIVTGYDTHGNPIVAWDKINEIKGVLEHDFRYMLSTWQEINYAERNVEWEKVEVRNEDGYLVSKDGEELDEDWYVLDEKRKRTDRRADPDTYPRAREMSRLENMFGADALEFIQAEIERNGLNVGDDVITVTDERTRRQVKVNISQASNEDDKIRRKFATAVWQGAFDYLVASEILAHRTRGSGDAYYDAETLKKAFDALRVGQILEPDQIKNIRKETNTGTRRIYGQDFGYAFATGGAAGVWKVFEMMFKDILSGK